MSPERRRLRTLGGGLPGLPAALGYGAPGDHLPCVVWLRNARGGKVDRASGKPFALVELGPTLQLWTDLDSVRAAKPFPLAAETRQNLR